MGCGCRQIRNVISAIPGGEKFIAMLPPLPEQSENIDSSSKTIPIPSELKASIPISDNPARKFLLPEDVVVLRNKVVAEALTWRGTPYHHEARVKGHGTDCGQFPLAVYEAAGVINHVDVPHYTADFHFHNTREWYAEIAASLGNEFPGPPEPGDFVLFKLEGGLVYSHGGIVTDWPWIMHASAPQRKVWSAKADTGWLGPLPRRFFRPKAFG